jgi:hypothetical protein
MTLLTRPGTAFTGAEEERMTIVAASTSIRPPFTEETARAKVQAAEDAWNTRDPEVVARAYTEDSQWRNRDEFFVGREAIKEFLRRKWTKELDYCRRLPPVTMERVALFPNEAVRIDDGFARVTSRIERGGEGDIPVLAAAQRSRPIHQNPENPGLKGGASLETRDSV